MIIRVITPPAPFVTWVEAKPHLRCEDEDQVYVESLIAAATAWLDGPAGWLGRAIGEQTLEVAASGFGGDRLPLPPLIAVETITYHGTDGMDHVMLDSDFVQRLDGSIAPLPGESWPAVGDSPEAVRVVYKAGYSDAGDPPVSTVPKAIKQAVLLLIGHWYRNRETVVTGTIATNLPLAVEALLSTYRVWR